MSDTSSSSQGGGKSIREKRRPSLEQPYMKPSKMPTRHSPARGQSSGPELGQLPLGDIMQELALLRRAMENRFVEAGKKSDALRDEVVGKLEDNDHAISELQLAVTDVTLSVDKNQRAIHEVRAEVERREVELPGKVKAIVQEALDRQNSRPTAGSAGPRPRALGRDDLAAEPSEQPLGAKDEAYDLARRSLRLWPVSREGDLTERTVEFLVNELRLDQQHAAGLKLEVKRAGAPTGRGTDQTRSSTVRDEVLVRFETPRERDDVRSFAKNLERRGRGLRLEIPNHLWPNFRVLQQLGYELKLKNPALRRNVLFDDVNKDLKMDVSTEANVWRTVFPDGARRSLERCRPNRAAKASLTGGEIDSLLGDPDVDMDEQEEF